VGLRRKLRMAAAQQFSGSPALPAHGNGRQSLFEILSLGSISGPEDARNRAGTPVKNLAGLVTLNVAEWRAQLTNATNFADTWLYVLTWRRTKSGFPRLENPAPAGVKDARGFASGVADPAGVKKIVIGRPRGDRPWARGTSMRVRLEAKALSGDLAA